MKRVFFIITKPIKFFFGINESDTLGRSFGKIFIVFMSFMSIASFSNIVPRWEKIVIFLTDISFLSCFFILFASNVIYYCFCKKNKVEDEISPNKPVESKRDKFARKTTFSCLVFFTILFVLNWSLNVFLSEKIYSDDLSAQVGNGSLKEYIIIEDVNGTETTLKNRTIGTSYSPLILTRTPNSSNIILTLILSILMFPEKLSLIIFNACLCFINIVFIYVLNFIDIK